MRVNTYLPDSSFWQTKRVFVTGHTGFKGAWLCLWLSLLGAKVKGYSLDPVSNPNAFSTLRIAERVDSSIADILDYDRLVAEMTKFSPQLVMHLAAQPLVLEALERPLATMAINALGTANVLEACRKVESVTAVLVITTDKVYKNIGTAWSLRENDTLGDKDPYSASKACAELITHSYRESFFKAKAVMAATARSGNVFGGGDWADHRIVPDAVKAFAQSAPLLVRNPHSIRPWQFVLEPLCGYLMLAKALMTSPGFDSPFNFGPSEGEDYTVEQLANLLVTAWGDNASWRALEQSADNGSKEAHSLMLNSGLARRRLGWKPAYTLDQGLKLTIDWYRCFYEEHANQLIDLSERQIETTMDLLRGNEPCVI